MTALGADADVREATPDEEPTARGILNAAMLEVDDATVERSTLLVAVAGDGDGDGNGDSNGDGDTDGDDDRLLGALVLDGDEIDAVAVRPGRRGQGIGSALVEAAGARRDEVTAHFDPGVRPFYESLGFDIDCSIDRGNDRCRGRLR